MATESRADRYARSVATPSERLEHCLARITAADSSVGALLMIDTDGARAEAAASLVRWRAKTPRSPVDGTIVAVKANIAVSGWPWHAGIAAYRNRVADRDAICIARLRDAGAVLIGLTNMDEAALGAAAANPWFGVTRNPRAPESSAGGSSGGSAAAVAADFCDVALGTDTMGSVRIPAAYCGVVGHKPLRGDISTCGIVPLSPTLDTVGVLGKDADDCRLLSGIMADHRPKPEPSRRQLRVAVVGCAVMAMVEPPVAAAFAHMVDVARHAQIEIVSPEFGAIDLTAMQRNLFVIAEIEGARAHRRALRQEPGGFSAALTHMLAWGARQPAARHVQAVNDLMAKAAAIKQALAGCDALLYPATPHTAFTLGTPVPDDQGLFSAIAATVGWSATSFPIGSGAGRPIAAEVMACDAAIGFALADLLARSTG